jgi:DNA repair protein RadC
VSVLAARVLEQVGGLFGLLRQGVAGLEAQPGIGTTKAARLLAAVELGTRLSCRPLLRHKPIQNSRDVDAALRPRLLGKTREHFFAVALDAKNHPLAEIEVAVGGLTACCVSPADVFRPLLREAAVGVIFAHNHPSGDPSPSPEDVHLTARLVQAGELLGIQVLDHLILGDQVYYSFLDSGLLHTRLEA